MLLSLYSSAATHYFIESGLIYWYLVSLVLAIIVYFHAFFSGVEPPFTWAFLTFAIPVMGLIIYVVYFFCFWKGWCVRKDRKAAEEIIKKWEDTKSTMDEGNEEKEGNRDNATQKSEEKPYRLK